MKSIVFSICTLLLFLNAQAQTDQIQNTLYSKGNRAPSERFTGTVWVQSLVDAEDQLDCQIAGVTFEPGARTNWHIHPGGQALLVTDGEGFYQEKGKLKQLIQKGDVVKCPPGVEHWHGATMHKSMTHIAILTNAEKGDSKWLQKVSDEEYLNK